MKKQIPLFIVIVLSFLFAAWAVVPHKISEEFYQGYLVFVRAMSPFGVILGIMSITMVNTVRIKRKVPNWQYSYVTLIAVYATAAIGFIWGTSEGSPYIWIFKNVQMPMSATMFSLLAFYISTAAYKAFRARSAEATVLLIAAIIVMLGQVPYGVMISPKIPGFAQWILDVPNLASKRGFMLGVGLGMTAVSLKIMLGIERAYLGGGD
ncbi:MAG: hypothetical protein P9L91_07825 [Candidatus Zophobacter franzmannii]|nr:hypothetical protein [Candidatus Zophobacter franzmannii]